jgi:hypothetical protein
LARSWIHWLPGCAGVGTAVWNPTDKADWFRNEDSGLEESDEVVDFVALDWGRRVATGYAQSASDREPRVWLVDNDIFSISWHEPSDPPTAIASALQSLAVEGSTVVGFTTGRASPAWYSQDGGESWAPSRFDPNHSFESTDTTTAGGGFYAAGRICCTTPTTRAGAILHSTDGSSWTTTGPSGAFPSPIESIAVTDSGLIALGEETYLSADGSDWHVGPSLPGYEPRDYLIQGGVMPYRLEVAAGDYVVAMTPRRVWYASSADLDPARWPGAVRPPGLPQVGSRHDYTLFTHCGPLNGSLQFGLRSWVPDLPEGYFPTSYDSYYEKGTLTLVSNDDVEFTGRAGDVISYHPTDDPPQRFPCA